MKKWTFKKAARFAAKTIGWTIGICAALLIILEIILSGPTLTSIVNKYADGYIDGELTFGKASFSFFEDFPSATLTLEDVSITYPSDKFDIQKSAGPNSHFRHAGCGEQLDTLASFKRFSVDINLLSLISGTIEIPYTSLEKPRIFAHYYSDGSSNLDIFMMEEEEETDTTESFSGIPPVAIGRLTMTDRPHIVYTDSRDTIFAMVSLKRFELDGYIDCESLDNSKINMTLDSMFIAGRISVDTLAVGVDRIITYQEDEETKLKVNSKTYLATRDYGRLQVPINAYGNILFLKDTIPAISFSNLKGDIADIPFTGHAGIGLHSDKVDIKAQMDIHDGDITHLMNKYLADSMPEVTKIKTDATLDLTASVDGSYHYITEQLPQTKVKISIPQSTMVYADFPNAPLSMAMSIDIDMDKDGKMDIDLEKMDLGLPGAQINAKGSASDFLSDDPALSVNGTLAADLGTINTLLPDSLGIKTEGILRGSIKGQAKLSQLSIYNFSNSSLTGEITGNNIIVRMPSDSINATIDGLKVTLGPEKITSRRDPSKSFRLVGINGEIAKADIEYGSELTLKTENLALSAKNSMDSEIAADSIRINPFSGRISASKLNIRDSEGTSLRLSETSNSFRIFPKKGSPNTPVLTLTSRNKRISMKYGTERVALNDANMRVNATMNTFERRQRMEAFVDSLAKVYPYIPKDSLVRHHFAQFRGKIPANSSRFKEDDFAKQDIDISLDKSFAKYFSEWDINGKLSVGNSYIMTPQFPLRNNMKGFGLQFTNDYISIDSLKLTSGKSDISATGRLSGLRRALLGRKGAMKLQVDIISEKLDADELLAAYSRGASFSEANAEISENLDDEEFMNQIAIDTSDITGESTLLVVPRNLNAEIKILATDINYSDLHIDLASADVFIKDRCLQITKTQALTNMGQINMEGFYATSSKEDIKAGFNLNFKDITAEKVINLMPAIDTLMPLLKSFGGNLNCEVAATTQIDTNMNIIMPSINGIMRISGNDLYIKDNEMFNKMAKLLVFKNKKEGHIDKMTVEGIIKDNKVEVFPFILEMDRYILGMSGVQNMDMSFKYHASLIKSPFLVKVGMDVYGSDFDNMKFRIGKPKYKSKDVPVFSTIIDDTKLNLVESIRNIFNKGVDAVMKDRSAQNALEEHKKKIGYVQAVDQDMEDLSGEEQKEFEAQQN